MRQGSAPWITRYSKSTDGSASLHESAHSSTAADRNLEDRYIVGKPAIRASK